MPEFLPFVRSWFDATFTEATPPQRDGWDAIASGRDTLVVAPTGSGKTLASFLWALDHLHRLGLERRLEDRVYVVYISPLRALNNDIEKNLRAPLAGIRAAAEAQGLDLPEVRVAVRTGDTLAAQRQAMTRRPPHVLITTPESLYILLTSERFRPAFAHTRFLIVDEIHALMGSKRGVHLALSLERLQALVESGGGARPQRIGCSATVSPIESALAFLTGATARDPITIDCGFTRDLDLQIVAPVDDFLTSESDLVWEATLQQIAELVQAHRTTLVFAQSRRAAERLARDLNDRITDGRVAAHHGSLSRRARLEAENRLKAGELRALVATSSLELGIDVGAIDLVVQVQSPRNIAAALQRVGRAGHLLSRTSKGRIVVTRGEELLEAAAVVRSIKERQLDRIVMPEAPLDVLTQQVVAAVAAESLTIDTLHARFKNAAPYRNLERAELLAVIRSVAEPLPAEVKGAAPRILWDRVNDRLHARRGSRFLALTSGGTIPDNGLYDVFVAETDLKVGTLDEEFVTESLPGDVFLLGSHAWKIVKVRADRVLVEDAQGMSPTIPFWKGEHPSRSWELGLAVGRLRRDAAERVDTPEFEQWAAEVCGLDARAASAMRAWLVKAGEVLDGVPDDQGIVVESFSDEMGGRHAMIHSVFGMRVNGAWGMVLKEKLRRVGLVAEASHVDDGILLSFAPGQVPPNPERLVTFVTPEEVDTLLGKLMIGTPLFVTRFRQCAVRALFIPRMYRGQRTPAYLQRLKADALLESVGGQAEFPIVAETLRECFNDALDVTRLRRLLERLHDGEMWRRHVDTPLPSPFVYPLLLAWDWAYLGAGHAEERRSDAVTMRKAWSVTPGPLRPELVAAVEAELQKTAPDRRARDANELAGILDDLGDLTDDEIAARVVGDGPALIGALAGERRVVALTFARRERAGGDPRRSGRPDRRRDRGARGGRRSGADRRARRGTTGRSPHLRERAASVGSRDRHDALRRPRNRRRARARRAAAPENARPGDRRLARRALRSRPRGRDGRARAADGPRARAAGRLPRRGGRAAARPHRGARRDPASPGPRAPGPSIRGVGRAVLGVSPPSPSPPSRSPPHRAARRARGPRAAAGRRPTGTRLGAGSPARARRELRAGMARSSGARGRDDLDGVRPGSGRARSLDSRGRRASRERRLASRGRGAAARGRRACQERPAPSAAPRRLVCPGPDAGDRPRDARRAGGALGALLGRARHAGHLQRDRGRHDARAPALRCRGRSPPPPRSGPRPADAPAGGGPLERPRRRGAAVARGAGRSARPAPPGALRDRRARAGAGRLGHAAPHTAPHGVRRRGGPGLLRPGTLGRAIRAGRRAWRPRRAGAARRAPRAGQHDRSGEPLGPRVRSLAPRRLARCRASPAPELARLPPGSPAPPRGRLRTGSHAAGGLGRRRSSGCHRRAPVDDGTSAHPTAGPPARGHDVGRTSGAQRRRLRGARGGRLHRGRDASLLGWLSRSALGEMNGR